jgi:GDP-mannose transporter
MFTVLKNLSNLLTIIGDLVFFGRTYSLPVWGSVFLMLASAAAGGMTDLRFTWAGYTWQLINCVFTSGYVKASGFNLP